MSLPRRPWKVRIGDERMHSFATFEAAEAYAVLADDPVGVDIEYRKPKHQHYFSKDIHEKGCAFDERPHLHHTCRCKAEWSQPRLVEVA